jgi:hypothetical protein
MKHLGVILATLLAVACSRNEAASAKAEAKKGDAYADLVFYGGPIHTGDPAAPSAEAVAVKGRSIAGVGALSGLDEMIGPKTERIDLAGAAMFPGFVDSHAHLLGVGLRELTLNLEGVGSIEELVEIVAAEVAEAAPGAVVHGRGWIETGWPEGRFPTREDLDPASPDNPVILERADGHAAVANSAALAAAKIEAATVDPDGGRIEKNAEGRPTGMLIDNAMSLVAPLIGAPTEAQKREAYKVGAEVYAAYGWTGMHNMSVDPADLPLMEALADSGDIPIRLYNSVDPSGLEALIASGPRASRNGRVVTRAVKLYMDGALGSRGAALLEPYTDKPDVSGLLLMEKGEADLLFDKALAAGIQVNTHAIGDRANRLLIDWVAAAMARFPAARDVRWRIEHAQILDPSDIARVKAAGLIASMQPSHAIGDLFFAPARLGPGRLDGAYAWRKLIDAGVVVAGGSDAPVERGDPAIEYYAAVERRGLNGFQDENWRAEEKATRAEALAMFTSAPAFASFREEDLGRIEVGRRADFSIFSADLMAVPPPDILKTKAVMTVVDGEIVWRADAAEER